ncbi:hypothetical protein SS50377_24516 [Spironucleus salmonicida]|uniref:TOG domain-containing protein n=1 Tax=Spironucleus salmonicida TaxID=348837 RepID=V6LQF8_9EUKA|nr:hypothetical protein SS50377_24516 [Spironucleus salmonicida]|eukprot:EST45941.1 hypothetical protein SS50377_13920 [Spironucleus salmonicida]
MQQVFEEQNEIYKALTDQIMSSNWKERKEALLKIQETPALIQIFIQNSALLLKDTNLVCLQIVLQILQRILPTLTVELPEIAQILINVVLQNTKTSIKQSASALIKEIYYINRPICIQALGQAIKSQNLKHVKQCLALLQEIGGKEVAKVIIGAVEHKNSEIKNMAIDIAKQLLNDPECLQIMEKDFPEAIFQQILFQAVSGDEPAQSPVQQPLLKSQNLSQDTKIESSQKDIDISQIDKLPWKERKEEIEHIILQIESGQQITLEFSRQLKYNIDNESNSACQNAFLKLAQTIAQYQIGWKYSKHIFNCCLCKLKEKRIQQQAHQTLIFFILKQTKLGDVIDDIITQLASKLTDQKTETALFLKNLFQFDAFRGQFTDEIDVSTVQANSILQSPIQLQRLVKSLILLLNESILGVRTIAQECLIQCVKLHMCSNAFIGILWENIFSCVLFSPKMTVGSIQPLILVILSQNYQNKQNNEYKRLFFVVQGIYNCLVNHSVTPDICNLHQELKFSEMVIIALDLISGPPIQEKISRQQVEELYKQQLSVQQTKSPSKKQAKPASPLKISQNNSPKKGKQSPQTATIQQIPIQVKYQSQINNIVPLQHQIDISKQLVSEVLMFQSNDKQQILLASFQIQQTIPFMLEQVRKQDLPIFLDSTVDFVMVYFAEKDSQVFIDGIRLLITLIQQYQDLFHPLSLIKLFDIFLIRISEQRLQKHIQDYITAVISIFGYQPIIAFILQNISESYIVNELTQILGNILCLFGLQDYYSVGLDPIQNIRPGTNANLTNNLFELCQQLLLYPQQHVIIQIIISYLQLNDQKLFIQQLQQIGNIQFTSTIEQQQGQNVASIKHSLVQQPTIVEQQIIRRQIQDKLVISSPQQQQIQRYSTPNSQIQQSRPSKLENIAQIQNQISIQSSKKIQQAPIITLSPAKKIESNFKLQENIEQQTLDFLQSQDENIESFIQVTNDMLVGQQSNVNIQGMTENLCYLLIDIYQIDDKYLPTCFPSGSLRVDSKFENFYYLLEQVTKNIYQPELTCQILSRILVVYSTFINLKQFQFTQQKLDQLLEIIVKYFYEVKVVDQMSLQIIVQVLLQLSLFQQLNIDPFIFTSFLNQISSIEQTQNIVSEQFNRLVVNNMQLIDIQNFTSLLDTFMSFFEYQGHLLSFPFLQQGISFVQHISLFDQDNLTLSLYQKLVYQCKFQLIDQNLTIVNHQQLFNTIAAQIYQINTQMFEFINVLSSNDQETYITAQKQLILAARDQKLLFTTPIIIPYAKLVIDRLQKYAKTSRSLDYRFLKYASLILLELVELPAQLQLFDYNILQDLIIITAYYAYHFSSSLKQKQSDVDELKLKEISDYFLTILIKIQQNTDMSKLFSVTLNLLENCYNVLTFNKQFEFPLQIPVFANQLQCQYLIKFLLQNQPSHDSIYQIPRAYNRAMQNLPFKNNPLPQLSSQQQKQDFFAQFSTRIGCNSRDIKLLLRFCRTFCEQNEVAYAAEWTILCSQLRVGGQNLVSSLVNQNQIQRRIFITINELKTDFETNLKNIINQILDNNITENIILEEFGSEIGIIIINRIKIEKDYQNSVALCENGIKSLIE